MLKKFTRLIATFMDKGSKLPVDTPAKQAVQSKIANPLKYINSSPAELRVKNLAKRYANSGQGDKLRDLAEQVRNQYGG